MQSKLGFVFWLHLILIILFLSSPFWVSYKLIFLGIFLYYVQLFIFGNCILTIKQFNSKKQEESVYWFILGKFGIKFNKNKVANFVDYALPWVILLFAFILQTKPL